MGEMVLKVIYSCYWGSYLSVVAASLHLGILDPNNFNDEHVLNLPMFNKIEPEQLGELFYIGSDEFGKEVYVMGSKKSGQVIERAFIGLAEIYGIHKENIDFIDLNTYNNFYCSIGFRLLKNHGVVKLGLALILKGIKKEIDKIKDVVFKVKNEPIYNNE